MPGSEIRIRRNLPGIRPEIVEAIRLALADECDVEGNPGAEKAFARRAVAAWFPCAADGRKREGWQP